MIAPRKNSTFEKFEETKRGDENDKMTIIRANVQGKGRFEAYGWILKKATSNYMGMANWQRRYFYLEDSQLFLFEGDKEKEM